MFYAPGIFSVFSARSLFTMSLCVGALTSLAACSNDNATSYSSLGIASSVIAKPSGFVDNMPGVPVYPGARATERTRPYNIGYKNSDNSMQAVYNADNASLPTLLRFYRNNMRDMGWQKHPDMELYRAPDGRQLHLTFVPQNGGSYIRFRQGYGLVSPSNWQTAMMRNQRRLYSEAYGDEDDAPKKTKSASLF